MILDKLLTPYFIWLLIFVITPTLILWLADYRTLWKYRMTYLHIFITAIVVGVAWDFFAITTKIWEWPETCCSLPRIAGLPLEETLFIIFVTLLTCTTTLVTRDIYLTHLRHKK